MKNDYLCRKIDNVKNIPFLLILLILFSCSGSGGSKTGNIVNDNDSIAEQKVTPVKLEPLKDETLRLKGRDPFGEIIELKGEQIVNDSLIFKPREVEIVIKDNFMVMKNHSRDGLFILFSLPELRLIKTFGSIGPGPDEFMVPSLCGNTQPDILATVLELSNGKVYDVLHEGALRINEKYMPRQNRTMHGSEYPALMTDSLLYFTANSSTGKSVFTLGGTADSIQINEIQNLALDPKRKAWANYIGDFAVNIEQNRMVYAYKYFKVVKFFDMENHTVRTVNFERGEFDESTIYKVDGLDANVTHYWGICSCEKHVYMLYSGRTPAQVWRDNNREDYYIYVEKYDWNGNPTSKYKLDRWGYFTVDEKNNLLYLVSTNDDDPFFRYKL